MLSAACLQLRAPSPFSLSQSGKEAVAVSFSPFTTLPESLPVGKGPESELITPLFSLLHETLCDFSPRTSAIPHSYLLTVEPSLLATTVIVVP